VLAGTPPRLHHATVTTQQPGERVRVRSSGPARGTRGRGTRKAQTLAAALAGLPGFCSAQEIHAELRRKGEHVSLATVDRHLQALSEQGPNLNYAALVTPTAATAPGPSPGRDRPASSRRADWPTRRHRESAEVQPTSVIRAANFEHRQRRFKPVRPPGRRAEGRVFLRPAASGCSDMAAATRAHLGPVTTFVNGLLGGHPAPAGPAWRPAGTAHDEIGPSFASTRRKSSVTRRSFRAGARYAGSPSARIVVTRCLSGPARSCSPAKTARSPAWMTYTGLPGAARYGGGTART
jgi:hypothetical protein